MLCGWPTPGWRNNCLGDSHLAGKINFLVTTAQPGFNKLEGRQEFTMLNCFFVIKSVVISYNKDDEKTAVLIFEKKVTISLDSLKHVHFCT
jgi:hypothetical protein